ncbi:TonB-dependent copper receptor [Candidatus Curculioniphilus buchneri]|uniref:TonB-dependent copper receptor n=1 Tax=Candidatus Curculioniphilus buchneri TaxID=690594 RepID=UPI00376EB3CE
MSDTFRAWSRPLIVLRAMLLLALFIFNMSFSPHAANDPLSKIEERALNSKNYNYKNIGSSLDTSRENDNVIVITAQKESPLTVTLSPKHSNHVLSANDSVNYLKIIPGFTLIRNGGTNGDPIFRGMFGSRLRMLVEGGEILGACASRMDSPIAYIHPENFDCITLIKGPQSVLWGPGASAGILQFERVRPHFDAPGMKLNSSILIGSNSRLDQNLDTSLGDVFGYLRLVSNLSRSGNYQDSEKRPVHSGWRKWNSDITFGYTPSSEKLIEISIGHGNGNAQYASRNMDGTYFKRNSIGIKFEQNAINNNILEKIEIQGWYHYADHVMDNYRRRDLLLRPSVLVCPLAIKPSFIRAPMRHNIDRLTLGGRSIGTWQWYNLQLQGGTDMQVNWHRKHAKKEGWQEDSCFQDGGIFAELKWWFKPENNLISGIRIENTVLKYHPTKKIIKKRRETYPAAFFRLEHRSNNFPLMIYCGTGMSERFPDYWEIMTLKSGRGSGYDAFDRLKREKTTQLDLGAHLRLKKFNSWISTYTGQIKDFILFRYDSSNSKNNRAYNVDARTLGSEMGLSYHLSDHWRLKSSAAWSFGKNKSTHKPLPQIPPLEGRFSLGWVEGNWSITGLWRLVAAQKHIALNEGNVVGKDFNCSTGFGVLSSNITWKASKIFKINAGVDNLLNRRYSEHLNLAGNPEFGYAAKSPLIELGRTFWARANLFF